MKFSPTVDDYIASLPKWQQSLCNQARNLIHQAEPNIAEEIKFKNRPYFTYQGNVCALLGAKDHLNIFIYDPIAPDPARIINQGHDNKTARSIQLYENDTLNEGAFVELIKSVTDNNRRGGWRKLKA